MADQVTRALTPEQIAAIERSSKTAPEQAAAPMLIPQVMRDQKSSGGSSRVEFVKQEGKERCMTVPLEYPLVFEGQTITEVTIRRPTNREWKTYIRTCADAIQEHGPGADDLVDQVWMSVPAVVLEELDFIDSTRVEAAQDGFFARSTLPQETEEGTSNSTSETGDTSPSQ